MKKSQSFLPEDVKQISDQLTNDWLKASEFDGDGLTLKVLKPLEKVKSQYGAEEDDYLAKNGILEAGESFRYTFLTPQGKERKIDSASTPFFIGFKQCEELGVGDWVKIVRTGKTDKTRYSVTKIDVDESMVSSSKSESEEIDTDKILF